MIGLKKILIAADLVIIAVTGWTLAEILSNVNLVLQTLIFLATLIGVILRTYHSHKKSKNR